MSRKVDPRGLRVGVTRNWDSVWYAEGDRYADGVIEDDKIRSFLKKSLRSAGLDSIQIERSIKSVNIIIKVTRPGIVIGRKGSGLAQLRKGLSEITNADIELQVEEVKAGDLSAPVVAENIAMQIERRVSARRAINIALKKTMDAGAKGAKIQIGGTVHGPNSIAVVDVVHNGAIPTQTLRADIDYSKAIAYTRGGSIGIKVWIYKGEIER